MRDNVLAFFGQVRDFWQRLTVAQKVVLSSSVALSVLAVVVGIVLTTRPVFSSLYTNLSKEDAAAIVKKLDEMKIQFQVSPDESTILVPKDVVLQTRLKLASEGLPLGGVGYEIFDKASYTLTDFQQKIQLKRALQGELERTISQLSQIEQARVHLVLPEPELFEDKEKDPTASVVVKLKAGERLQPSQIKGIVHLVAHSVEGLKIDNVEVIDIHGEVLSDMLNKPFAPSKMEAQREYERHMKRSIESMLERVLGPDTAVARVTAYLDFNKKTEDSEIYKPVVGKEGIPRSEQSIEEKFKGTGVAPGGVPGVTSNIPGYPGATQGEYQRRELTTNYEISKIKSHVLQAPGDVLRLSVAIMVDTAKTRLTPRRIRDIQKVAAAAVGIDTKRGDQIEVIGMAFSTEIDDKDRAEQLRAQRILIMKIAALVLLGSLILFLFYLQYRPPARKVDEFVPQEAIPIEAFERQIPGMTVPGMASVPFGFGMMGDEEARREKAREDEKEAVGVAAVTEQAPLTEEEIERQKQNQLFVDILKLIDEKPKEAAHLIKSSWLMEE